MLILPKRLKNVNIGKKIKEMEMETHIHNEHVEFVTKAKIRKNLERLNNGD